MKPKALLIMPRFMGYDSLIFDALSEKYETTFLDADKYKDEIWARNDSLPYPLNAAMSIVKPICNSVRDILCDNYTDLLISDTKTNTCTYDFVLCINGGYLSKRFFAKLRQLNPGAKFIYYAWDDVDYLFLPCRYEYFDDLFSYNIDDCAAIGAHYLPMFTEAKNNACAIPWSNRCYDIAFIGTAHENRLKIANGLVNRFSDRYKLFIYLYDSHLKPNEKKGYLYGSFLSQKEYFEIVANSRCLVEVPNDRQDGPTTRLYDAAALHTKIATTNEHTAQYPIFTDNVMVIDPEKLAIPSSFLEGEYKDCCATVMDVHDWFEELVAKRSPGDTR